MAYNPYSPTTRPKSARKDSVGIAFLVGLGYWHFDLIDAALLDNLRYLVEVKYGPHPEVNFGTDQNAVPWVPVWLPVLWERVKDRGLICFGPRATEYFHSRTKIVSLLTSELMREKEKGGLRLSAIRACLKKHQ